MVKHRRYSDKPKDKPPSGAPSDDTTAHPYAKASQDFSATPPKTRKDLKSILLSGTKYIYIVAAAALFSGIFTPLTLGVEVEIVVFGILTLILGLVGGILIFLGSKNENSRIIMILVGLALLVISLILINEIIDFSIL